MNRTICLASTALCLFTATSSAQTPSAVIREGDVLAGAPPGHLVTSLGGTGANDNSGYVVQVNSSDGTTTLSHCWGTGDGSSPMVLQTEATYGPLVQTSFESFLGIADTASVCYSASGTGGPAGGFDSVWVDSTPIAVEGDPIPSIPGKFFRFGSRPGITGDGLNPYFVGGITSTSGGSTESYALFYGMSPTPLLQGGDVVPGLPEPLDTSSSVSFDYRISTAGTNYIAEVQMVGPSVGSTNNNAMVFSGSGLMLGGALVQEGTLVPVAVGGDGTENWDNFDYCGITETGEYIFTGDTDGDTATDEIVVINGMIVYREGDTIDGYVVEGSIEKAAMNESGQSAFIWDVSGGTLEALFAEGQMQIMEGDEVDWDGDGTIDAGYVITDFTGIASLSLASDPVLYFTADVDTAGGGVLEGLFALPLDSPFVAYCPGDGMAPHTPCPCGNNNDGSMGGCDWGDVAFPSGGVLGATGSTSMAANNTILLATAVSDDFGIFFGAANQVNGGNGNLLNDGLRCAGGALVRLIPPTPGVGNAATLPAPVQTLDTGAMAGVTRRYQYWFRTPGGPCGQTANLTNGLEIVWEL